MPEWLKNPSLTTLVVVTFLLVIPFFWPVTLYAWVRALTGHKAAQTPREAVPKDWGANS